MNHYDTLGVTPSSSHEEVHTAYRIAAIRCHPDTHPDNAALIRFLEVFTAMSVLGNADMRREYDKGVGHVAVAASGVRAVGTRADADRMFVAEMADMARELSALGYARDFIVRALSEEGCPLRIAHEAAASVGGSGDVPLPHIGEVSRSAAPAFTGATSGAAHGPATGARRSWGMALGFVCVVSLFAYFLGVRPYLDTQKEIAAQKVAAERERVALITRQQEQESQRRAEAERSRLELVARQQDEARRQADERSREQERLRMEGQQRRVQLAQAESVQQARAMQNSQAALAARTETLRVKCEQGKTARRTNDPARVPACIQHQEMAQQQRFKAAAAAGVATEAVACNPRTQRC